MYCTEPDIAEKARLYGIEKSSWKSRFYCMVRNSHVSTARWPWDWFTIDSESLSNIFYEILLLLWSLQTENGSFKKLVSVFIVIIKCFLLTDRCNSYSVQLKFFWKIFDFSFLQQTSLPNSHHMPLPWKSVTTQVQNTMTVIPYAVRK